LQEFTQQRLPAVDVKGTDSDRILIATELGRVRTYEPLRDLIETVAVDLNQGQNFTADHRQFLFDPITFLTESSTNSVVVAHSHSGPRGACQWKEMTFKELAAKKKAGGLASEI